MTKPISDTGICVVCKKPYPKVKKNSNIRKRGRIRKRSSVTCSHKCSEIYYNHRKDYVKEKMDVKEIKSKIELVEYYNNGFNRLSGAEVKVINIKLYKKTNTAIADVILVTENERNRYYDCEYNIDEIYKLSEKLKK